MSLTGRESSRLGSWVTSASRGDIVIVATVAASVVVLLVFVIAVVIPARAMSSARPEAFHAGLIISDDSFYNADAMSAEQVQRFLENTPCTSDDDSPCLADYRQDTVSQPMQYQHCANYDGGHAERASTIIWKVAQACGISPRVLLVLVQKEQSLVSHPSASGYERATGYACPDTAACDAKYFGFFNQVYNAAWQFRSYTVSPSFFRYNVGPTRIGYHPNASCGSSVVDIRNQATANLYNYTPYQPNRATIRNPDATTRCSAYGNLNFWLIYSGWFGSPLRQTVPPFWDACLNHAGGSSCSPDPKNGVGLIPRRV